MSHVKKMDTPITLCAHINYTPFDGFYFGKTYPLPLNIANGSRCLRLQLNAILDVPCPS